MQKRKEKSNLSIQISIQLVKSQVEYNIRFPCTVTIINWDEKKMKRKRRVWSIYYTMFQLKLFGSTRQGQ